MGPALAQTLNPSAALGKQRAAASHLEWEVKEAGHPVLGNIRFAFLKTAVETPVGNQKVYTRAYLSCLKGTRMLAIELTNATAAGDQKGLKSNKDPRLICNRPETPGSEKMVHEDLLANWDANELGDMLAKGFRAFPLRECVSIKVVEEVALPAGWSQKSARVEFEITPYNRQVDEVFATCGDVSAYDAPLPSTAPKVATAPKAAPKSPAPVAAVAPPKPAPVAAAATPPKPPPQPVAVAPPAKTVTTASPEGWLHARALSTGGKTNVRASPSTQAHIVVQLDPGTPLLAQSTGTDWWRVKAAAGGAPFEGFIRQDRLAFR